MSNADRIEIVRRAFAAGWSYDEVTRITGVNKPERYAMRRELAEVV